MHGIIGSGGGGGGLPERRGTRLASELDARLSGDAPLSDIILKDEVSVAEKHDDSTMLIASAKRTAPVPEGVVRAFGLILRFPYPHPGPDGKPNGAGSVRLLCVATTTARV